MGSVQEDFHQDVEVKRLQERFSALLPDLVPYIRAGIRRGRCQQTNEELEAEALALCWAWTWEDAQRGVDRLSAWTTLAYFAVRRVRSGGSLCRGRKAGDVLEPAAGRKHGVKLVSIDNPRPDLAAILTERLASGPEWSPAEQVGFRLDFAAWTASLTAQQQSAVEVLSWEEGTTSAARVLGVSPSRVSQLRRELLRSWTDA